MSRSLLLIDAGEVDKVKVKVCEPSNMGHPRDQEQKDDAHCFLTLGGHISKGGLTLVTQDTTNFKGHCFSIDIWSS